MADWQQALKAAGRRSFPWVAGASLLGAAVVWTNRAPADGQPVARAELSAADSANRTTPELRLQFFSTPWPKVLNKLAEETGSTLVMQDVPPGRYSRNDWGKYTRREAVQILNRELEPLGFRILEKDQFLTVIQIRRMRLEYQRPIAPVANTDSRQPPAEGPFASGQPVPATQPGQPVPANPLRNLAGGERNPWPLNQVIPAGGAEPGRFPGSMVRPAAHEQPPADSSSSTVSPQHRAALDIAKQLHQAFGERSALVNQGPNGLPAFTVTRTISHGDEADAAKPATLFTVEIDTAENSLIITAPPEVQVGLRGLINGLDVNPLANQIQPQLMAGSGNTVEIAEQLKAPLAQVAKANAATAGRQQRNREQGASIELAQANQQPPGQAAPPPQPPQQAPPDVPPGTPTERVLQSSLGNLKGDVTIESMPDLDLLILRGNKEDVEKVMEVIRQVEELAAGTMPEIRLHLLEFVDSQSLAALLNDLYTRLAELRARGAQQGTASVAFVPIAIPNALLILAPSNSMEFIIDLVLKLDQPVNPEHQLQVFRLKYAVAADVAAQLEEFYQDQAPAQGEQLEAGLQPRLNVVADPRTNSLIVQATPRDMVYIASFIEKVDQSAGDAVSQMKLFELESASAPELAAFLYAAIESVTNPRASTVATSQLGGFGAAAAIPTAQTTPKSVVLEILAENGQELIRSGLLTDIRFNADARTNTLAVTAPEQSMPLITELVDILDRPSSAVAAVKVFPLKNTDATVAVTLLQELFPPATTTVGAQAQGVMGVNLMGTSDISNLVPLQFSADPRANAVVATGGEKALLVVEAILLKLDTLTSRNRTFRVIKIRNSQATAVSDAINAFLQSQRALLQADPLRYSVSEMLQQEFIVTPEVTTNSLIISASPEYMDTILQLAEKLDAEPNQVLIQALIVEVTLDNTDEFGVELGFQDSTLFDRSVVTANDILTISQTTNVPGVGQTTTQQIISQASTPGFAFNNQPLGNNTVRPEQLAGQALSNFSLGRVNSDLGYGGLVLSASSENISILVRALAARRNLRVLSRPQVLALDNTQAQIQVGQDVPVVNGVTILQNIVNPTIERMPSGIILTVLPRVSADGQVFMTVAAEKSQFDLANGVPIFTDATNGNVVTAPIKNVSTAATTVKVPDGQTIVLGGMITRTDDTVQRKVPWLGDIPLLGSVFRYDRFNHVRTELLIFLTPRIIHGPADFEFDKQVEADRMHWFQDEAEEVHGPIFGVPPEMALPVGIEAGEFCPPGMNGGSGTGVVAPPLLDGPPLSGHSVPPVEPIPTDPITPQPTPVQ